MDVDEPGIMLLDKLKDSIVNSEWTGMCNGLYKEMKQAYWEYTCLDNY